MKKLFAAGAAVLTVIILVTAPAEAHPRFQKRCGSIHALNSRLHVAIVWTPRHHRLPTTCRAARSVSKEYLRRSDGRNRTLTVRRGRRKYTCYKARSGGSYACNAFRQRPGHRYKYVGIGIGKRL